MELKEGKKHTGGLRRPFGVAGELLLKCPYIFVKAVETKKLPLLSGVTIA